MANKVIVAPSILSCDFARIGEEMSKIEKAGADWAHIDIMDGHFVDNLTIGPPVVAAIKRVTKIPLDVHLMIEKPELTLERYVKAGADVVTIHVEACEDPASALKKIRDLGASPGITLRPETPLSAVEKYFSLCDLVLIMTVNPGWGGQAFMGDQMKKVKGVRAWAEKNNKKLHVEVDGGINAETVKICREAGADVFVAGNYVFKSGDYAKAIAALRLQE